MILSSIAQIARIGTIKLVELVKSQSIAACLKLKRTILCIGKKLTFSSGVSPSPSSVCKRVEKVRFSLIFHLIENSTDVFEKCLP